MAGIYIHIPFCKQACHYCDFHFSTNMKKKGAMIGAICEELRLRKPEFEGKKVQTIYFGGGTPSLLAIEEIKKIIDTIHDNYDVTSKPEITLEANPDDLSNHQIVQLSESPINRLSIGVQSFFDEDLQLMNRAHSANEAENCIEKATEYFSNISIDLIYGIPNLSHERWKQNIEKALSFAIPHISSYALTVEPRTALQKFIENGTVPDVDDELAQEQFQILATLLEQLGFVHYETSNFGKPGYFSQNNTAYWQGKHYIGVGPSAHSYDGRSRSWNVRNNSKYIEAIAGAHLPQEQEELSKNDRYNEYVMTGLRTIWGVSLTEIKANFGPDHYEYILVRAEKYLTQDLLCVEGDALIATKKGKFLMDGIAADLFLLNLKD